MLIALSSVLNLTQGLACLAPRSFLVKIGAALGIALALYLGRFSMTAPAFYVLLLAGCCVWFFYHENSFPRRLVLGIMTFILGIAVMKHVIPGISNWNPYIQTTLSPNAMPWNLWINFDKAILGTLIFMWAPRVPLMLKELKEIGGTTLRILLGCILSLMLLSLMLGFVLWEPKVSPYLPAWAFQNLLGVTLAEEAFFRLFLQSSLIKLGERYGVSWHWGWIASSIIFGIYHFPSPPLYIALCTLAGLFYGYAFHKTQRIEASIAVHFLLNLTHFVFFTYPFHKGYF